MSKAKVEILWEPSKSNDVVIQKLVIMTNIDGQEPKVIHTAILEPQIDKYDFFVDEKTYVNVKLTAYDGTFESKPMINSFYVPDLTAPFPPVSDGWKILEVEPDVPNY